MEINFIPSLQLDATETEEISDGVLVRLQSQQMLDQIHGDDPLQASGTRPVDGENDSSESEEDPCESIHSGLKNNSTLTDTRVERIFDRKHPSGIKDLAHGNFCICTIWLAFNCDFIY